VDHQRSRTWQVRSQKCLMRFVLRLLLKIVRGRQKINELQFGASPIPFEEHS
jgi:hypothetical protein